MEFWQFGSCKRKFRPDAGKHPARCRVQFWLGMFDKPLIEKLHGDGISCNLFYADDFENYRKKHM